MVSEKFSATRDSPPKPVGIWIRVSTEDQAKGESPEHHEKRARYYAESKGWKVIEVYHLEGVSGKDVGEHPEAKRMLVDIKQGKITGLIFSKLARLARNTRQLLDFADYFTKHGADLISLQESIDTSTPAGRLFYTMIAAMAQWEREEIASRVAASVPIRAKLGKSIGGAAPFGYEWKDKRLRLNEQEAPIRRLIYDLFLEHKRKKTVAKLLNQQGYRTRKGGFWTDTSVDHLLRDPIAKGIRRMNYLRNLQSRKEGQVYKPESEWIYQEIAPLISEEVWNNCQAILNSYPKKKKRTAKKAVHLFAGFVYCHCGNQENKMYVPSNTPKYVCQQCRNKIPIPDLEAIFQEELKHFFFSKEEVGQYLQSAETTFQEKQALLDSLTNELQKTKSQMDKLLKLYYADEIPKEGFGREYKPLEQRFQQLNEQIPTLQGELDLLKVNLQSRDEVISQARDLYSNWPNLDQETKRAIIEEITQKIIIGENQISIDLYYLPSSKAKPNPGPNSLDDPPDNDSGSDSGGNNKPSPSPPNSPSSSEIVANKKQTPQGLLPFCQVHLIAKRINKTHQFQKLAPEIPSTLGDHLLKRRLDLGISITEAAKKIETDRTTLGDWEANCHIPDLKFLPRIYGFLGYCLLPPFPPATLPAKLKLWRESQGLTQLELANLTHIDESSLARWERGETQPYQKSLEKIQEFFGQNFGWPVSLAFDKGSGKKVESRGHSVSK